MNCQFGFDIPCRHKVIGFIGWRWICHFHLQAVMPPLLYRICDNMTPTEVEVRR